MTYAERDSILRSLGYFDYAEYLQSPLWKQIRQAVLQNSAKKCRLCKCKADVVHHRSYAEEVLTGEKRDESVLVALCDPCHYAVEFRGKAKRSAAEAEVVFCRLILGGGISNGKKRKTNRFKAENLAAWRKKRKDKHKAIVARGVSARANKIEKHLLPISERQCVSCKQVVKIRFWGSPDRQCERCKSKLRRLLAVGR